MTDSGEKKTTNLMNAWKPFLGLPHSNNYFFWTDKSIKIISNFRMTKFDETF